MVTIIFLPRDASPAEAALQYASLGWPVLPLYELRKLATERAAA